jgi:glycosyltransferase involved in cell wall biosynthesis
MFVTIITITYNAEASLERTLQSILDQDSSDFDFLLIDGKSTDRTLEEAHRYHPLLAKKGISFRWISEPDHGIYDAMNKGLKLATGEFVWFVNAGDSLASPTVLSSIIRKFSASKIKPDFIYGETMIVNSSGEVMGSRRLKAPEVLTWKSFNMGMLVCHQSMLIRRELAKEYDTTYKYSADYEWAIRCLQSAKYIYNTHLVLSHFLDGGLSKQKMKASLKERFAIMVKYYGWCPTVLRHIWFVIRAAWFRLLHGWI